MHFNRATNAFLAMQFSHHLLKLTLHSFQANFHLLNFAFPFFPTRDFFISLLLIMNNFWNTLILNNTIREWMYALGIIVGCIVVLRLIQSIVIARIKVYSTKTKTLLDDVIISLIQLSVMPILYVLSFYYGLKYLNLPPSAVNVIRIATMVATTFFVL